jgi:hypothetical protein
MFFWFGILKFYPLVYPKADGCVFYSLDFGILKFYLLVYFGILKFYLLVEIILDLYKFTDVSEKAAAYMFRV